VIAWFQQNIRDFSFTLGDVYEVGGISRQGYHQQVKRYKNKALVDTRLVELTKEIRGDHPRMGARKLFEILKLNGTIGINKYEQMLSDKGLGIPQKRSAHITTNSNHAWRKYSNLINGHRLTGVNQVWASDITYYMIDESVYYITFMMDVYSRRILAYTVSDNMFHENNVEVLNKSVKLRKGVGLSSLIHHSDKGSQYCSNAYIKVLNGLDIQISMAHTSIENPYVERLNGIIKNDYLYPRKGAIDLKSLRKELDCVVKLYNEKRPHAELENLTPVEFEWKLLEQEYTKNAVMELYNFDLKRKKGFLEASANRIIEEKKPASNLPAGFDHSPRSNYSSESCSPAELSSASFDNTNIEIIDDVNK
jgi:putative transposase